MLDLAKDLNKESVAEKKERGPARSREKSVPKLSAVSNSREDEDDRAPKKAEKSFDKPEESNNLENSIPPPPPAPSGTSLSEPKSFQEEKISKEEQFSKTKQELLAKVKRKKENQNLLKQIKEQKDELNLDEEIKNSLKDEKSFDISKIDSSKLSSIKEMLAKIQRIQMPERPPTYDIYKDYTWYYHYYLNSFNLDQYSAAYYAQYAIVTSKDYKQHDISVWMQSQGYDSNPQEAVNPVAEVGFRLRPDPWSSGRSFTSRSNSCL